MRSSLDDGAGPTRGVATGGSPVVPQDPPPWVARAAGWTVLCVALAAGAAAFLVRLPETVTAPCVLVPGTGAPGPEAVLRARLRIEEGTLHRLARGQRVRLSLDAYPAERYGTVPATLESVSAEPVEREGLTSFEATASLDATGAGDGDERRPLRAGLEGTARIVVADRTIAQRLLEPTRSAGK